MLIIDVLNAELERIHKRISIVSTTFSLNPYYTKLQEAERIQLFKDKQNIISALLELNKKDKI